MNTVDLNNAQNSILAVIREYQSLDTKGAKISVKLLAIAGEFGTDHEAFAKSVLVAANTWKAKAKKKALPTHFTQVKSNIIAAMKLGINPSEYPTESAMRTALNAKRKELKDSAAPSTRDTLTSQVTKVKTSEAGTAALAQLLHKLSTVDTEQADALIIALTANVDSFVNETVTA